MRAAARDEHSLALVLLEHPEAALGLVWGLGREQVWARLSADGCGAQDRLQGTLPLTTTSSLPMTFGWSGCAAHHPWRDTGRTRTNSNGDARAVILPTQHLRAQSRICPLSLRA